MTHDLSNTAVYPRHHFYRSADGINIFSKATIKKGDTVRIGEMEIELTVTRGLLGTVRQSNYHDERDKIKYYEFGIKQ